MKILFLHLSDAHLKNKTFYSDKTIEAQVRALKTQGNFDKCCIMFSGDITYSGQTNEFKKASGYLGKLWKKMTNEFGLEHSISTFVVPGNHDIDFGGKNRNREDICEILNEGITDEIVAEELAKFKNFYDFAQFYKCFTVNKLVDVRMIKIGDKLIQINLVNSELFAVCNDKHKDDDKGKHYLPESEWNRLCRGKNVDLVVTISHRGPEWFEWESANSFKKSLNCHTDLFLYGHEHINDINMSAQKDNNLIKSIARGIDFPSEEICFTTLLVDLGKNAVESTLFKWDSENDVFTRCNVEKYTLSKSYSSEYVIQPSNEYIQTISIDENRQDINNYFVFPGVESLGQEKESEIKDFSEFLSLVTQKQQVIIEGDDASGKTALLTKIYLSLVGNYVPIYLNEKNLVGNNPEKAIKIAFESQYGDKASDYEKFLQVDKSKKVVLIDDLDKIKERYLKPLEEYLLSNFGHIVNIVAPKWDADAIIDWAKDELDVLFCRIIRFFIENAFFSKQNNIIALHWVGFFIMKGDKDLKKLL